MKITVNYISNVFLAVILAVIPYTALIKLFIKNIINIINCIIVYNSPLL